MTTTPKQNPSTLSTHDDVQGLMLPLYEGDPGKKGRPGSDPALNNPAGGGLGLGLTALGLLVAPVIGNTPVDAKPRR